MKKKVILYRMFHRGQHHVGIRFPYDSIILQALRSSVGILYSSTHKCYYTADSEENIKSVVRALKDIADLDLTALAASVHQKGFTGDDLLKPKQQEEKSSNDVPLPKAEAPEDENEDIEYPWPENSKNNEFRGHEKRQNFPFAESRKRNSATNNTWSGSGSKNRYGAVEFTVRENEGLLVIRFRGRYEKSWIEEMRTYGKLTFDKARFEWLLRWSKLTCDSLADYFSSHGVEVKVSRSAVPEGLAELRKEQGDEIRSRELCTEAREALTVMARHLRSSRYSVKTANSYLPLLELFFKYYHNLKPSGISYDEIKDFIHDYVLKLGYSASYQNQMVSAIKTYYDISGLGDFDTSSLERPRRGRALPKVFSKEEVKKILNSARNIKHKLILWMVYSCGLRRSELTNIKLTDLDRGRKILHIREGKGQVDRIVPVSDKVWAKVDDYIESYSPSVWLFEGVNGGRYSVESVYQIFKQALKRAGIKRDVGVHSLRHSYATHLHESGLDIRYIQELLGHKSTKTTEIYTHVSRRNLVTVRSPIEDIDLK